MSENKAGAIYKALAKAQSDMGPALKDSTNPAFKTKYADLSSVMAACLPALNANGIAVIQPLFDDETGRYVKTILAHESGETLECRAPLIIGKNDMQGYGSAVTYARRYGLMAMAGIAPDDDDGNDAVAAKPRHGDVRESASAFDPAPHIAAIEAATTGKALLEAITPLGARNDHPAIAAARVDRLITLIRGAQTAAALDAFKANFGPDWAAVKDAANARIRELNEQNADLEGEIPY